MLKPNSLRLAQPTEAQLAFAQQVLRVEAEALLAVAERLDDEFVAAIDVISECSGNLIVTGMGKAGLVAQKIAATLSSTGTRAHFLHPAEAVHGDLGKVDRDDLVLAFSHSGETAELTQILGPVKSIGAKIVGVTSRRNSKLGRTADVVLCYGPVQEACPLQKAPSSSCVVMMAIGDAVAFSLMKRHAFSDEDFGRYHPAGSLGKQLQRIEDVMRVGPQLRIASCSLSVADAFVRVQKSGRRTGAVLLTDDQGRLAGIFTDSDLARLFEQRTTDIFDRPISELMTKSPITLQQGQRVQDAVSLLRDYHVSEIPVVDEDGRPVGVVDITDLVDLMPEAA